MKNINKLVRDNIPNIIDGNNEIAYTKILDDDEYIKCLNDKLIEEAKEVISSKNKEELTCELADLYEVMMAISNCNKISLDEIEKARVKKKSKNGGFEKKIFLIGTDSKV